ncbi:MAG: phasin family protein [Hyphomicrobiales bacterium]|nr:phasin family protein [Hyphomicrobiales bacterium]
MMQQFEAIQKVGKENVDAALKSFGAASKGLQAIAVESSDYTKKSFDQGTAMVEKLVAVKTIDKAIELQSDFAKSAYEGFVAQATKIGELYTAMAKDAFKPFEAVIAKATPSAK